MENLQIKKGNSSFFIGESEKNNKAIISYVADESGKITVDHTVVSDELKGQKIGSKLVKRIVEFAREENLKIVPVCSYAKKVIENTEEYRDVLAD